MTAPIFEPSPERKDASLTYADQQLFRRPSSSNTAANSYCYMEWNAGATVTVNTLTEVSTLADYNETFISDPDNASFSVDAGTGCISWSEKGEYYVHAWAQFDGGATAGSTLGVALTLGNSCVFSTFFVGNIIIADAINDTFRIPVSTPVFSVNPGITGHNSAHVSVYHNDAGGQDLNSVRFTVIQIANFVTGTFGP